MFDRDEVKIETPEQIELGLEPSGPGSRLVAWVLDALIKVAILLGLFLLVAILGSALGVPAERHGLRRLPAGRVSHWRGTHHPHEESPAPRRPRGRHAGHPRAC